MAFARGPFSQWLNSAYHMTVKEIVQVETGTRDKLLELGILSKDKI